MTTFDERESAFENKFVHDAELEFRAEALRNRMVAYWAAEVLGEGATFAAGYAKEIIRTDFQTPGDEVVIQKLIADLDGKTDEATIRAKMQELLQEARVQVGASPAD